MSSPLRKTAELAFEAFHADLRSLALARMAIGAVVLIDLVNRAVYLEAHYTDWGILPRTALLELNWRNWYLSLHLLAGEPAVQAVLFLLAGLLALMLVLGYRTRLVTIASWFLLLSLHNRNPMILNSGDDLLRMLLFWAIFMPWGARWSLDRALAPQSPPGPDKVFSAGALAFFVQIAILYVFTGLLKSGEAWWVTRLAVYDALSFEMLRLPLGGLIYPYPEFLKFMTAATLWLELLGPVFFFMPFRNAVFRWLAILAFTLFQLGLALTLMVGMFPWASIAGTLALIPSATWKHGGPRFLDRLFDGCAGVAQRCRMPGGAAPYRRLSKVEGVVVLLLLAYVLAWNWTTLPMARQPIPTDLKWIAYLVKFQQKWTMFGPYPPKKDGWFVIPGELRNGQEVDLFRTVPYVRFDKPAYPAGEFGGARWRKYMRNLWLGAHRRHRLYYGRYLCRTWNRRHGYPEQVVRFEIVFVEEATLPDYRVEPLKRTVLWRHECFPQTKGTDDGEETAVDFDLGDRESEL